MKVIHFIRVNSVVRSVGFLSAFLFVVLSGFTIIPVSVHLNRTEAASGTATESTITLDIVSNTASVDLTVNSSNGTFAASGSGDEASFGVTTNNYTGYTLSISSLDDTGTLDNDSDYLSSIPLSVDKVLTDSTFDNATYNGNWAYKPSTYRNGNTTVDNTGANAVYLMSPTTQGTTLDVTSAPNNESNTYTIGLGARADYTKSAGTYSKTFNLIAVGNPVTYTISFDENTTDQVGNMPATQSSSTSATSIVLPATVPTREHYTFLGWCNLEPTTDDGVDSCSGTGATVYNPNGAGTDLNYGIDQTTANIATLYAMWGVNSYVCYKEYRLQNIDGTYPSTYTSDTSESIKYGDTCTYSKTITDYQGDNGNDTALTASEVVSGDTTVRLSFPRNTYTLTIEKNNTYIDVVSGAGNYRWGETVQISANTLGTGEFLDWTQTAGDAIAFAVATDAATSFEMPKSNVTIYAEALMRRIQNLAPSYCTTDGFMARDSRDNNEYLVRRLADGRCWMVDTLDLAGGTQLTWRDTNMDESWSLSTGYGFLENNTIPSSSMAGFDNASWASVYNSGVSLCDNTNICRSYYSWTTATLGSGVNLRAENTDAPFSICPKGWKLPNSRTTAAGNSDYYRLATAYGMSTGVVSQNSGTVNTRAGYGTAANFTLSGYGGWSWFGYNGEFAALWSSTAMADANNARYYVVGASVVNTAEVGYRNYGSQIRCILVE